MRANVVSPPTTCTAFSMGDMCSIPPLLGNTYSFNKALPNLFRHCLIAPMKNAGHLGAKLKQEAERLGLKPAQVAEIFEVKPPSVYDWYEHGRIHKKHYPKLVEMSGRPIQWWLDFPKDETRVAENSATYLGDDHRHKVLLELFDGLPSKEQDELIRTLLRRKNSTTTR